MKYRVSPTTTASASKQADDGMGSLDEEPSEQQSLPGIPDHVIDNLITRRLEEQSEQQLLPGIPDHVSDDLIIRKLSWKEYHILSVVSRSWNQLFRKRLDARLRSLANEKNVCPTYGNRLYSPVDGFWCRLPPIPNVGTGGSRIGFTECSLCVILDGRVYCLGGDQYDGDNVHVRKRDAVYVMDMAGERQWQPCKSMLSARRWTDCLSRVLGLHGKIYLHCDSTDGQDQYVSRVDFNEVYDTESNTWDVIKLVPGVPALDMVPGLPQALDADLENMINCNKAIKSRKKSRSS